MGPLTNAARANRVARDKKRIRDAADKLPPRIEIRRVPAMAPIEQPTPDGWHRYDLNKRPEHRVIAVPVFPPGRMYPTPVAAQIRDELFQAMQYGLDVKNMDGTGTTIRWWSYLPVREALLPEVRHGLRRAQAYVGRIRAAVEHVFPRWPEGYTFLPVSVAQLYEWLDLVIEDISQNLGDP